jgi:prevent-host-death family protein
VVFVDTISIRELRNHVSEVVRRVEAGERLTVTVDRRPVAEIIPIQRRRAVPIEVAEEIRRRFPLDGGILADIAEAVPDTTDDL